MTDMPLCGEGTKKLYEHPYNCAFAVKCKFTWNGNKCCCLQWGAVKRNNLGVVNLFPVKSNLCVVLIALFVCRSAYRNGDDICLPTFPLMYGSIFDKFYLGLIFLRLTVLTIHEFLQTLFLFE